MKKILVFIMLLMTLSVGAQPPAIWKDFVGGQVIWEDPRVTCPEREKILTKSIPPPPLVAFFLNNFPWAINQGNQGSCVAFAFAYYKSWQEAQESGWKFSEHDSIENLAHQISPGYFYNMLHVPGATPGIGVPQVTRFIAQNGALTLEKFGYNEFDDTTKPSLPLQYEGLKFRGEDGWYWFHDVNSAKYELQKHPLVTVIHNPSGSWHCILLIGYNDTIRDGNKVGAFRFINSAGRNWGENGYGYYFYDDLPASHTFWAMNDEPNHMPEKVFLVKFDWASNTLGEIYEKCYAHFLKGRDTIKTVKFFPGLDEYFLLLDTAVDADRLIMTASYNFKRVNKKEYPITNQFYGISSYDPLDNSLAPLQYTSELTQKIADSVEAQPNWIIYTLFSELEVTIDLPTLSAPEITPSDLSFYNYPNPFRGQTNFKISLKQEEVISLLVVDNLGREIRTLALNQKFPTGDHLINFAADLPAGMYFAKLICRDQIKTIKIMVID